MLQELSGSSRMPQEGKNSITKKREKKIYSDSKFSTVKKHFPLITSLIKEC